MDMNELLLMVLIFAGFVSFIPVVSLFKSSREQKYRCLKLLMLTTFVWTIFIFMERISATPWIIYYAHLMGYPLKFLVMVFALCTILDYVDEKIPKIAMISLLVLAAIEIILVITHASFLWFVQLELSDLTHFSDLYQADKGSLFLYHLIFTYAVMFYGVFALFYYLNKKKDEIRQYQAVTKVMVLAVVVVIGFNLLQLFFIKTNIDLTYISLVVVTFTLYRVIYSKDMIFNLLTSGRGKILSNMRELYILTDADKRVVEFSEVLKTKYGIDPALYVGKKLEVLLTGLKHHVVLYQNYEVDVEVKENKDHYHLRERKFYIQGDDYGFMILLYDETQVFKLLRELNQLSNFDAMTGLNNRNYIETRIKNYKQTKHLGVISLDLNGLKVNNDYLGHERGDYLLKSLANKIKQVMSIYGEKEIARIGGDEFIILIPEVTKETLENIKSQIMSVCDHENLLDRISVSIGIAYDETGDKGIYDLVQLADQNMYAMKSTAGNSYSKEIIEYVNKRNEYIR